MSLFNQASLVVTPNGYKAGKLYSIKPDTGKGDFDVVRATGATRVNEQGLIESVGNNVPRIDYPPLGGCPSILVEPSATNLALRSEEFDNAYWDKTSLTVTADDVVAPDGTTTADIVLEDNVTDFFYIERELGTAVENVRYSFSIFIKRLNRRYFTLSNVRTPTTFAAVLFDFETETFIDSRQLASTRLENANVQKFVNGWYRISGAFSRSSTGSLNVHFGFSDVATLDQVTNRGFNSYAGDITKGGIVWGAQYEEGSNATSYIPTVASTVTRNADVISKTGASALIGQTEGTLYAEVDVQRIGIPSRQIANLTSGTANFLALGFLNTNIFRITIRASSGTQYNVSTSALPIGNYKLAATYKAGELKLYVNGFLIGTNTNASVSWSTPLDRLNLDNSVLGNDNFYDHIKAVAILPTAITDQQAIALTTL